MTKVFIDTNVFLDMYRANLQSDISTLMGFLFKNKKHFITTEQSISEFTRNRLSILEEALESFKKYSTIDKGSSSFLRSLSSFKKYDEALTKYRTQRQAIIDEIQEKIEDSTKDLIYSKFKKLCHPNYVIDTTSEIVDLASRRKLSGNPPTSDKYTCGDEIIWESLLAYECQQKEDLIIVSNDKTFIRNKEFLTDEYARKTGKTLAICSNILDAYRKLGVELSNDVVHAEENLTWTDIIVTALANLNGQATLSEIYAEANDIIYYNDCHSRLKNKAIDSTIRGVLQRFSSDFPSSYNGSKDLFHQVSDGIWALR